MKGVVFTNYTIVKELIEKTTTCTGLKVIARIVDKQYHTSIKMDKDQIDFKRIQFNTIVPKLSYYIAA